MLLISAWETCIELQMWIVAFDVTKTRVVDWIMGQLSIKPYNGTCIVPETCEMNATYQCHTQHSLRSQVIMSKTDNTI